MTIKKYVWPSILVLALLSSCSDTSSIEHTTWKYGEGYHWGDFITFQDLTIANDTLYQDHTPFAILENIEHRGVDKVLTLRSIETNQQGRYFSK